MIHFFLQFLTIAGAFAVTDDDFYIEGSVCQNVVHRSTKRRLLPQAGCKHVYKHRLSHNKDKLFVWYLEDRPPRRVAVYTFPELKRISDFVPGFGGTLSWTQGDCLFLHFGCGTGCQSVLVFSAEGQPLDFVDLHGGFYEQSPSGRYLATFTGWHGGAPISIYDFVRREKIFETDRSYTVNSDIDWSKAGVISFIQLEQSEKESPVTIRFIPEKK